MVLGFPTALFWLALAVPIIALYIAKVRLRRLHVSTNLFWQQIYEAKPPRSFWQHLRHLFSLLLQLLLLLFLVLAVADPSLPWQRDQSRRMVLVVDCSASMQANDVQPTRFVAAIDAAHRYIDGMRSADEMAIMLAGDRPEVVIGMSSHVPTLRRALSNLVPRDVPGELKSAVELARRLAGDSPGDQIVVLTDGCAEEAVPTRLPTHPPATSRPEADIKYRRFSSNALNIGVTQFQVRRCHADPLGYELLVQIKNASAATVRCRLELQLNELPIDILPLTLGPNEVWSRSIKKASLVGGRLSGHLTNISSITSTANVREDESVADAASLNSLSIDDTAWAYLPDREVRNVLLVTPGNLFLQKVFESNPLVDIKVVRKLPDAWPQNTLIVMHQLVPERIPAGDVLIVDPNKSTDLWTRGKLLDDPIITDLDRKSSLMTNVDLEQVQMSQTHQLRATGPSHVLAGTVSGDLVYAELLHDNGRCLLLATNLDKSDLAFRTVFPIMISNALGWFTGASEDLTGSTVVANKGLLNARESDLRPVDRTEETQFRQMAVTGWFTRPLWFYLATVACVLTVTEWFLYHRRFTD